MGMLDRSVLDALDGAPRGRVAWIERSNCRCVLKSPGTTPAARFKTRAGSNLPLLPAHAYVFVRKQIFVAGLDEYERATP
jgi:hypothetical protein